MIHLNEIDMLRMGVMQIYLSKPSIVNYLLECLLVLSICRETHKILYRIIIPNKVNRIYKCIII